MSDKKKIILYPNSENDIGFEMAWRVREMLEKIGRHTVFCPLFVCEAAVGIPHPGLEATSIEDELADAEMIITFGGDGTILRASRVSADFGVPILGVNLGGKGFMAELEVEDIELIASVAAGGYKLEYRMMLDAEVVRGGEIVYSDFALNDIVVKGDNKVIDLVLFGDGQRISHFSGDGAVIATPTGSTAYSMAAGGPIVEPAAQNIIVTPICAHILEAKAFVLVSDRHVSVEIGDRKNNPVYMSVDGGDHVGILRDDVINIRKSERCARLVRLTNRSFYKKVSDKLGDRS